MESHQSYIQKFSNFTCTKTNHPTTCSIIIIFLTLYFLYKRRRSNHHLFTFKPNPSKIDTLYCAVCLENVADGERCRKLPKCRHCFHVDCIDSWFEARPTCPLCRSKVHYISKHQKKKSISSYFLSLSQHIAGKIGRLVVDRIAKTFSVGT